MNFRILFILSLIVFLNACKDKAVEEVKPDLDALARKYVKLALTIGQYDKSFVDAYYGPDSLKPKTDGLEVFPKDSLINEVYYLIAAIKDFETGEKNDTIKNRAGWMSDQLVAFAKRIKVFSTEYDSFDNESEELFGIRAPEYDEKYYKDLVSALDTML